MQRLCSLLLYLLFASLCRWVNAIVEDTTKAMVAMNKPFKCVVT
jgi:hypothetical protein